MTRTAIAARERLRRALPIAAVVLFGLAAYSNTFRAEFVFDDDTSITTNPLIRDLGHYLLEWTGYGANPNRFVGNLTLALNYRVGGLDVIGYHAVNLAIHLLNALLVHALVVLSFRTPRLARSALAPWSRSIALVAALLFVSHPIETQAVTYVVQRFTSLATTFYLLTVSSTGAGGSRARSGARVAGAAPPGTR